MSRSSPSRAQTEPLAALIAVSAVIAAIGLYAFYVGGALPGLTDRAPEETAIERVWDDLRDDERGVFIAAEYDADTDRAMREAIDRESLPHGSNLYVEIRIYEDGEPTVLAAAHFDSAGDGLDERQIDSTHSDFGPPRGSDGPDETGVATRRISVEVTPGDVRGGTLHVEAW